ncbi:MAG: hypothetical protein HOM58_13735 [Rhodospirillaceae bacterium]|jgi:2-methylcitrate dehydratase PrpD|nr:hypothetical protein [Rhodospirillaceae bacterium]MBT7756028.1 hypothetical protein [Rhodospirillaceae bacterium]
MDGNHTQALAEFAAELCYEDLPAPVVETVKHIILDSLGCALAATTLGDGCAESIAVMERLGGPADSTILGTAKKVAAPNAAFANGALVHALNYDPIGTNIGHVGVVSLAAPLAAAEAVGGQTGRDLIVACAVAAEVTARVISAVSRTGRRPSETFLSGQLLTYFGAAAGAGRAFGLDAKDMENAFGLAMMQMAGSRQITMGGDPPAKAIYGAFPNQAGVQAALLARAGLTADVDVFGEPAGLYPAIYGGGCDTEALVENLGDEFFLTQVGFKPWPTSNQLHPAIEAAIEIAAGGLDVGDIKAIEITVPTNRENWCAPLKERQRPKNAAAAANSIPFCVAKALVHGDVTLSDVTAVGLTDEAALAAAARTSYGLDDQIRGAKIRVVMNSGASHNAHIEDGLGSSERPISVDRLTEKFRDCCRNGATGLSGERIDALVALVGTFERQDDIDYFVALAGGDAI